MLAVLGHSGSGKSTLLDMLAGRKRVGALTGQVLVNGVPRGPEFYQMVAYVPQGERCICLFFLSSMQTEGLWLGGAASGASVRSWVVVLVYI